MGWSAEFLQRLAFVLEERLEPMFILEFFDGPMIGAGVGNAKVIPSHQAIPGYYGYTVRQLAGPIRMGGASVALSGWRYTNGAWSVGIAGPVGGVLSAVTRGSVAQLLMGFPGWTQEQFQPVALGSLRNLRGREQSYTLEFVDILAHLGSRLTLNDGELALFHGLPEETTLNSAYTVGDATLSVTAGSALVKQTGGNGALRIEPSSGADPFYLRWSAQTGGSPSTVTISGAADDFGTVRVAAAAGSVVRRVVLLDGHPADILARILTSTGTGSNGAYDVYPADWGYGLAKELLDVSDLQAWRDNVIVTSLPPYDWGLLVEEEVDNGWSWLATVLADAAIWPVVRQGRISVRSAQPPNVLSGDIVAPYRSGVAIDDSDILGIDDYEAWDSGLSYEASRVHVTGLAFDGTPVDSGGFGAVISTLPAVNRVDHDLTDRTWLSASPLVTEVAVRVRQWETRIPERLSLRCKAVMAKLVPGDLCQLTTRLVQGRLTNVEGYVSRNCMVTQVAPDWTSPGCRVVLAIPPTTDQQTE